jgi:hypothetical protein
MCEKSGQNVRGRPGRFNLFFLLIAVALSGCASTPEAKKRREEAKEGTQIRVFREATDFTGRAADAGSIGISKAKFPRVEPVEITVQKSPILDERDVKNARVIDTDVPDQFVIGVEFTEHGALVLQMNSVAIQGRRLVIAGRWSDGKIAQSRWLSAPVVRRAFDQGVLVFTPDCTRDEADRIVRGLNNVAVKLENQEKPKKVEKRKKAEEKKRKKEEETYPKSRRAGGDFDPFSTE